MFTKWALVFYTAYPEEFQAPFCRKEDTSKNIIFRKFQKTCFYIKEIKILGKMIWYPYNKNIAVFLLKMNHRITMFIYKLGEWEGFKIVGDNILTFRPEETKV